MEVKQPDQEQRENLDELWSGTGLLKGIGDRYQKSAVAVMLENQRLVNEMLMSNGQADQRLTRMSIPFVRRIFGRSDLFQMVSVQPLLTPTGIVFVPDGYGITRSYEIPSRTMRLTPPVPDFKGECYVNSIDEECDVISDLSNEYSQYITRHVIQDIRNAAGIQLDHVYRSSEDLVAYIKMASGKLVREMGGQATWIVVSPSIAYEIIEAETDFQLFEVSDYVRKDVDFHKFGLWNKRWTVYVDPLAPTTSVVMGHKGEHYHQAGYVFSPYAFYSKGIREENDAATSIVSLIGKRLVYPGFYATINIGNYSITEIEREDKDEEFLDRTTEEGRNLLEARSESGSERGVDAEGVRGGNREIEKPDDSRVSGVESECVVVTPDSSEHQYEEEASVNAEHVAPQCEPLEVTVPHVGGSEEREAAANKPDRRFDDPGVDDLGNEDSPEEE